MQPNLSEPLIKPLSSHLGGEVFGVDLAQLLASAEVQAIEEAMRRHKVLLFRDQELDAAALARFGRHFGELQAHVQKNYQHAEVPEVVWMTNRKPDGAFDEIGAARGSARDTRDGWHSDMAFDPIPAKFTILHALEIPSSGGNTCFANTEMVYQLLDRTLQEQLTGLEAEFSYGGRATNARNQLAANALSQADRAASVAVHPVISVHPETGVPAIFISPYTTSRIRGIASQDAQKIFDEVYSLMDSTQVRWEHQWSVGDTIMWENRSGLMHSGRLDYPRDEARIFIRTTVRGAPIKAYATKDNR